MPTIAFLSQKGGAGKTTLATCVARELVLQGLDVVLVDADSQGSARDWRAATDQDTVAVVGMDRPTLDKDLKILNPDGKRWINFCYPQYQKQPQEPAVPKGIRLGPPKQAIKILEQLLASIPKANTPATAAGVMGGKVMDDGDIPF